MITCAFAAIDGDVDHLILVIRGAGGQWCGLIVSSDCVEKKKPGHRQTDCKSGSGLEQIHYDRDAGDSGHG